MKIENLKWELISDMSGHYISQGSGVDINLIHEYTMLIKEAAKCEAFSADILSNFKWFNEAKDAAKPGDSVCQLFGFRRLGVDGEGLISRREPSYYTSIWKIEIENDPRYDGCAKGCLYKANLGEYKEEDE